MKTAMEYWDEYNDCIGASSLLSANERKDFACMVEKIRREHSDAIKRAIEQSSPSGEAIAIAKDAVDSVGDGE